MSKTLDKKIDFAIIFAVENANPNGDPLNGNRPRMNYEGFGEVTDVCLKRKIRDRLQETGKVIFVQSDEKKIDSMTSLKNRAEDDDVGLGKNVFKPKETAKNEATRRACEKWFDVRAFGQVFAFGKTDDSDGVSIAIRGPVTIQSAFSVEPINITSTQITKSVNNEGNGSKKGADTMGMKHRVDKAVYVTYGAISQQLATKTGFSYEDAETIKNILPKLFEGDASSARPDGSMVVKKVIWWEHGSSAGQYSSAKVHNTLNVNSDGTYVLNNLVGLKPEEIDGF